MIFEQVATGGCQSYLLGCADTCAGVLIDPEVSQVDRYLALAARDGLRIRFVIDTHTHADHFSASRRLAERLGAMTVMHRASPAPGVAMRVDDGESIVVGKLRLQVLHTPGHTADSMCLVGADRVFTGDTLLIGGTGRTDLPSGDPEALFDSLFGTPARARSGAAGLSGARLQGPQPLDDRRRDRRQPAPAAARSRRLRGDDEEPRPVDADPPHRGAAHQHERRQDGRRDARRGDRARAVHEHGRAALAGRGSASDLVVLDVREKDAYEAGHIPGARLLPRGQLELRVDKELPDPTARIVTCCEFGRISTLAAATLRTMGFQRAVALDGGMKSWLEAGYPVRAGAAP